MAKYRTTDAAAGQGLFLSVNLKEQLLPDTFEHMLDEIISEKIDTSVFDQNYKNDLTGASAVPPSVLLKLIIYAYSKGRKSSRGIWELSRENIVAKALTGDMDIHWTTIADFISGNSQAFNDIFVKVLAYCNELGLIGGETFAIDGLRLPSNASIEMSGTRRQLKKRLTMYRKMAEKHLARHIQKDAGIATDEAAKERCAKRQKHLSGRIAKISRFLEEAEEKIGKGGQAIQSNVTDNESAMIHSSKGYVQGYIGIAVSDQKNQIITSAQAVGTANEGEHLPEMLDQNAKNIEAAGVAPEVGKKPAVLGDSNYFSEENLKACEERGIEAVIPDGHEKKRAGSDGQQQYEAPDFKYHKQDDWYECPQGKILEHKGKTELRKGEREIYQASLTDCKVCPDFSRCSHSKKAQNEIVQGRKILVDKAQEQGSIVRDMREKKATEGFQALYAQRIQIVEPVFANIRYCKGLNRFMLRGKKKVNGQWQLYCMVHNLGKCLNELNRRRNSA